MRAKLAAVLPLLLGCGASGALPPRGAAERRPAAAYSIAEAPRPVRGGGDLAAVERALFAAADQAGLPLHGDGRLALLAQRFAGVAEPDPSRLEAAARRLGLVDVELRVQRVQARAADLLPAALQAALRPQLQARAPTHAGAFVAADGRSASVALGRRPPALDPIARTLRPGALLRVRGRLPASQSDPTLVLRGPQGEQRLPAGPGPAFELQVRAPAAGVYQVELHAREGQASRAVAALRVYAGVAPGAQPSAPATPEPTDLGVVRAQLYRRAAALRAAQGLPELAQDGTLERRAQQGSTALAGGAQPADAGTGGLVLRAPARGADEQGLWDALLADNATRARLLSPDVTHLGIGVARAPHGLVTLCLLARLGAPVDPELDPARVLAALNENRRARGAGGLHPDPQLTEVARRAASELAQHPERSSHDVLAQADAELERFRLAYGRVAAVAALVLDPLEAGALEPALDPRAHAAGIAVAQGTARGEQVPRNVVVIALGWER